MPSLVPMVLAVLAAAPPGRIEPGALEGGHCYGWSATGSAFVLRQKETCTAEKGCVLGVYLARVGQTGGARTVGHLVLAKNPAGRVTPEQVVAAARPKFLDPANATLAAEAGLGCFTESPDVSFVLQGHQVAATVTD